MLQPSAAKTVAFFHWLSLSNVIQTLADWRGPSATELMVFQKEKNSEFQIKSCGSFYGLNLHG